MELNKKMSPPRGIQPMTLPAKFTSQNGYNFGRMDSDQNIVDHVLRIGNQTTLAGVTYRQLQNIGTVDLPITLAQFTRMWHTLMLKRVQDVFRVEKGMYAPHRIRLNHGILIPGPLTDLLNEIGMFHSQVTGHIHHVVPPTRPAVVPDYWTLDDDVIDAWTITMARVARLYTMKDFPSPTLIDDRPMVLTIKTAANDDALVRVKAFTREPKPQQALITAVNDDLFEPFEQYLPNDAHLHMTPLFHPREVIGTYVGSYVLDTNA